MSLDVNGTRFYLVLRRDEWLPATPTDLEWFEGALRLRRKPIVLPARPSEAPLDLGVRRGAGCDRYGNWYWIADDEREIRIQAKIVRTGSHFWSPGDMADTAVGDFTPCAAPVPDQMRLRGLAVTADHHLVVGTVRPSGILAFDLHGGGPPVELLWPEDVPFSPFDLAPAPDGGVFILDRDARAIWALDRALQVRLPTPPAAVEPDFRPKTPAPEQGPAAVPPASIDVGGARPLTETTDPIAIESLGDGTVLVLDAGPGPVLVHRYGFAGDHEEFVWLGQASPEDAVARALAGSDLVSLPLGAHDFAFVARPDAAAGRGTVWLVGPDGNQALAFDLVAVDRELLLELRPSLFPMRLFTGRALAACGPELRYDQEGRLVPLVEQPQARFLDEALLSLPLAGAFDGRRPGCVWHRLVLDASIPDGCSVTVESRAGDDEELLETAPWQPEPPPYLRGNGSEIPFYRPSLPGPDARTGSWELLFQRATGRYLQVRLTVRGTGRNTPLLKVLRIHFPRFSYLERYLPAVYRDDSVSASFLDRYLANLEGLFTTVEGRLADIQVLFDTRTVPAAYLDWLAGWLGGHLDQAWSQPAKRLFLAHAPQLFRERGTCAGIVRMVRLAIAACPGPWIFEDDPCGEATPGFAVRIVERFRTRRAPGVVFGDPSEAGGPGAEPEPLAWRPQDGAGPVDAAWHTFLAERYPTIEDFNAVWGRTASGFNDPALRFPAIAPDTGEPRAVWLRFVRERLDRAYAPVSSDDEPLYREFLARRYAQPQDVNIAYGLSPSAGLETFEDVLPRLWNGVLRAALPASTTWLRDWVAFASLLLPIRSHAHRFIVLIPMRPDEPPATVLRRRELAQRVVEEEKPAHTRFEVKLYYALFQVGTARVGLDTIVGDGSRSVAIILGVAALAAGHLGFVPPWGTRDRMIVGRELGIGSGSSRRPTGG